MGIDLHKFKKILLKLKDDVSKETVSLDALQSVREADEVDSANSDISAGLATKFISRRTAYLKRIEMSLQKVENKTYGECESCGADIAEKRLLARPTALLCIDCKQEQEHEEQLEKQQLKGGFLVDWE